MHSLEIFATDNKKQSASMRDNPPEDKFDSMLDDAPFTGPHMPEHKTSGNE